MIYFITFTEGGYFIAVEANDASPETTVEMLKDGGTESKFVALFEDGACYDGFIGKWRCNEKEMAEMYNHLYTNENVPKINVRKLCTT